MAQAIRERSTRFFSTNGIKEAAKNGVLAGYEVVDYKVTLLDGSYHEVDSSEMAFKIAGSMAFKDGCLKADPCLLEPIMKVQVVNAEGPLGEMFGYATDLRSQTQGRGNFTMEFLKYAEVPRNIAETIIGQRRKAE